MKKHKKDVIQYIWCFKNLWGSVNILLQIPLKVGKKMKILSPPYSLKLKNIIESSVFESRLNFFSKWSYLQRRFTSPNVVKIDVENDNIVSTLSNVVQFNVEIYNVVWTLLNVVNFNVDIHNVVSTLIWRCVTSLRHINLKTTLNRRWNVCWVGTNYWCIIKKIFGKDDLFSFPEHITSWACFESGLQDIFHLWAYSDIFCRSLFSSLTTIYNRTWWCVICKEFYCSQKIVW